MNRNFPLLLVLSVGLGLAASPLGCKSKSKGDTTPGAATDPNDPQPGGVGGPDAPTAEELNTNPTEGIEPASAILEAGQFTDGPVWHAGMGVLFFATPLGEGALFRMLPDGRVLKVRDGNRAAGTTPIGNAVTAAGELITAEAKRLVRVAAEGGEPTAIATSWSGGAPAPVDPDSGAPQGDGTFDTLNDVVARKDGTLYVTDPGYFAEPAANRLYRVDPAGVLQVVETFPDVPRPNGIALSPDEKTLYVGFAAPVQGTLPFIRKYIVNDDGSLGEWTKFIDVAPGDSSPDGLAVDKVGNVYVATRAGVEVYKSDGKPWGTLAIPEKPTGLAFGGEELKTLFVTTEGVKLWQLKLKIAGIAR